MTTDASAPPPMPDPSLLVLVGPSGSGKSTWAGRHYRREEIVSSDELRSRLGSGPADLDVSAEAFEVLELIATTRIGRGLTTVVDTLGYDGELRRRLLDRAKDAGLGAVAVVFRTDAGICRERNRSRARPVPAEVLSGQLRRMSSVVDEVRVEGWQVLEVDTSGGREETVTSSPAQRAAREDRPGGLSFHLQVSRFGDDELGSWSMELARRAEDIGFAGISVMDHLVQIPQVAREWEPMPEAMTLLGWFGAASDRLRLCALVSPVTFRHPVVLGRQLATLDVLTGGRVDCGLGAGWFEAEHRALGIEFPPVADRMDALEDTVQLLRLVWGPGAQSFEGRTMSVPRAIGYPRPTHGTIPILVGGGGEQRTLRIAAAHADAWNVRADPDVFRAKADVVRRHCDDVGRDPATLTATVLDVTVCGRDRAAVADLVERTRGRTDAATWAERHHAGTPSTHVDRYRELEDIGVERVYVSLVTDDLAEAIEGFAPVVAAFA